MCQVSSVQNYLQTCHPVKINLTCVICTGIPAHESTGQNYPDMCHPDKITWICVTRTKLTGYVSTRQNCPDMCNLDKTTQFRTYIFSKQCCAVAWTKGIHPASEKISKKQCCAVAPTYSAFLLRLKIGHIFFLSTVALLRGDWDSDCFRKSLWKAVLRSCKHLLSFSAWAQFRTYFFSKQCCAVAWNKGNHPA